MSDTMLYNPILGYLRTSIFLCMQPSSLIVRVQNEGGQQSTRNRPGRTLFKLLLHQSNGIRMYSEFSTSGKTLGEEFPFICIYL